MSLATPDTNETAESTAVRSMDVRYINPFLGSVTDIFKTMLNAWVRRGTVSLQTAAVPPECLTALIGLSGSARGVVTVVLPVRTAVSVVNRMLGEELTTVTPDVIDGVAEMVNLIAGGAKARLVADAAKPIDLGLPTVVTGDRFAVSYPSNTSWLEIPFDSQLGYFSLRVTVEAAPDGA